MNDTKFWVLYDPEHKSMTERLSTEDIQMVLFKLKTKHIERFLIWSTGWPKWKKLKQFLANSQSPFMASQIAPATEPTQLTMTGVSVIKMKPASKKIQEAVEQSFVGLALPPPVALSNEKPQVKKSFQQFNGDEIENSKFQPPSSLNFSSLKPIKKSKNHVDLTPKIELLLGNKKGDAFRCQARNLTEIGASPERTIPAIFLESNFDVILITNFMKDPKLSRLKLRGKTVQSDTAQFIQFESLSDLDKKSLQILIEHFHEAQQNSNSQAG